jgi:hypothetical protein
MAAIGFFRMKEMTKWIRSKAAKGQALNLHAVMRERPDLLEQAFGGTSPRGWRRSLIDAGVDPYKIELEYEDHVNCAMCGQSYKAIVRHLSYCHGMTVDDYQNDYGQECELLSESCRVNLTRLRPIVGIAHWERLWSSEYVIDWILLLRDKRIPLNHEYIQKNGMALTQQARKRFGSWDDALRAAGLNPEALRAKPKEQSWTRRMVIDGLRDFAKARLEDPQIKMINALLMAISRFFPSRPDACHAAGVDYKIMNPRMSFPRREVARVVVAIRKLQPLKAKERLAKLDEIYQDPRNQLIVIRTYGSLRRLAIKEGIPLRVVAREAYRDEADVHHDLDTLKREGKSLTWGLIKNCNPGLNLVMLNTGWGTERLKLYPYTFKYPTYDPKSELLKDRMILLRSNLGIGKLAAANMARICSRLWSDVERGLSEPSAPKREQIERLLQEHGIYSGRKRKT